MATALLRDPWVLGCLVVGVVLLGVASMRQLPVLVWLGWAQLLTVSALAAAASRHDV